MMAEPVRVHSHPALAAPAHNHLVNAVRRHRAPVVHSQPQLRPVYLGMPCPDPDVAVEVLCFRRLQRPQVSEICIGLDPVIRR
jgi:hypothetical protein